MVEAIKFADTKVDLCVKCSRGWKGGCPIYPPLKIVTHCVEYVRRGTYPSSKK